MVKERSLYERIYEVVGLVPDGKVVTYSQIARHLGMPRGARAVGWAMRRCPAHLPWHRVVNSRGEVSQRGHPSATSLQRSLLEDEGVVFDEQGRIDLRTFGWDGI